jgi:hypothetical protein
MAITYFFTLKTVPLTFINGGSFGLVSLILIIIYDTPPIVPLAEPGETSPSTQIVPITGVQVMVDIPSGTKACRSKYNSATTDLYLVPQFSVTEAGALTVTTDPSTETSSSSRTSVVGSYAVAENSQPSVSNSVISSFSRNETVKEA